MILYYVLSCVYAFHSLFPLPILILILILILIHKYPWKMEPKSIICLTMKHIRAVTVIISAINHFNNQQIMNNSAY